MYHGPRSIGKSIEIKDFLKDRQGVVYIDMKSAGYHDTSSRLAQALEIPQIDQHENEIKTKRAELKEEMENLGILIDSFVEACKEFKKERKERVIVVVDGLDTCPDSFYLRLHQGAETLVLGLASMFRAGLVSVVYIFNDFRAFNLILAGNSMKFIVNIVAEGHKNLEMVFFPSIPDDDLSDQLSRIVAKKNEKTEFSFAPSRKVKLAENEFFVFQKESDAYRCARLLGSHMLDIAEVLYQIVELKIDAEGNHSPPIY